MTWNISTSLCPTAVSSFHFWPLATTYLLYESKVLHFLGFHKNGTAGNAFYMASFFSLENAFKNNFVVVHGLFFFIAK